MSEIKPFRALRPVPEKAKQVSCVPYDVIDESEVREFIESNPLTFLRVTRPEAGIDRRERSPRKAVFEMARRNLQKLIDDGIYFVDDEPCFYVYRISTPTHRQTGVVACCSLDEYERGLIKKHEKTRPDKVDDRTAHLLALGAQTGLIFLTFRGTERIKSLTDAAAAGEPIYDLPFDEGVRHTIWHVPAAGEWADAFDEVPALYIADGHHRVESASRARKVLAGKNPRHTGDEEYNHVVAGIFPAEELKILPYNRIVRDLNGLSEAEFLQRASESFVVTDADGTEPKNHGEMCMYLGGKWYGLRFAVDFVREPDPIERLDVSILQQYILGPVLGIKDARTDPRIGFVGGKRGTGELERKVDSGKSAVAFSMFPTTMDDLFAISDMDEIMPPKSTWFEPKLRDGLLVHLI